MKYLDLDGLKHFYEKLKLELQGKNLQVNVKKTGNKYYADKTYRQVQQAIAQGKNVFMFYNDSYFYFVSKSQGASPYLRFAWFNISSGVATEKMLIYRLQNGTPIIEYQEHNTSI